MCIYIVLRYIFYLVVGQEMRNATLYIHKLVSLVAMLREGEK